MKGDDDVPNCHPFTSTPMSTARSHPPTSGRRRLKARYIMIGGFLGAGKTTAVAALAKRLVDAGLRVGLITNDQGRNLVDTAMLRAQGFATEEIPGGCFCCRFNSLVEASQRLTAQTRPDVFIAEPVGSCTDLAATVTYPLRRLYGKDFVVAPVSVLVDPIRARRVLGLEPGGSFSPKVLYIYHKQIEEADLVVISKCDLLDEAQLESLRRALAQRYPRKEILAVSVRRGVRLEEWFDCMTHREQSARIAMDVDYATYADGEALLGWLNATVELVARRAFDAEAFLKRLAGEIQRRLQTQAAEVAHLKMTLSPHASLTGEIAAVNLARNDFVPELSFRLEEPVRRGQLILNLRAEATPDVLGTAVREGLIAAARRFPTLAATLDHLEHFRPGKPTPTHRIRRLTL
jgi:G3E family GTPase